MSSGVPGAQLSGSQILGQGSIIDLLMLVLF
jgi:hypothetical protein